MHTDKALTECDYGEWQGRKLRDLGAAGAVEDGADQPVGRDVPRRGVAVARCSRARSTPYAVGTPRSTAEHGADAVWLAVSHGDVIKSVLADALGMHLDLFQRIQVDPASISVIRYTDARPYVLAANTHEGDLSWLVPPARGKGSRQKADHGAAVGGGAGAGTRPERSTPLHKVEPCP